MSNYYFVGTYLSDLEFGKEPGISFSQFERLLKDNLTSDDYKQVKILRAFIDIENLRLFWKEKDLDRRGNYSEQELNATLNSRETLPAWLGDFLDEYGSKEEKLKYFAKLWAGYFKNEIPHKKGFLKDYLTFEWGLRLVLAAFRAKKLGRDIAKELQFEDPDSSLVQQIMAEKDAKTYTLPPEYEDLASLLQESGDEPEILAARLNAYRFQKIEEMIGFEAFSLDRILAYMAQLFIVEKNVDPEGGPGEVLVEKIINAKDLTR